MGAGLGAALVRGAAPVQCLNWPLVLRPQPDGAKLSLVEAGGKRRRVPLAPLQRGIGPRRLLAGEQELKTVVAGVGDPREADQAPRLRRAAPGNAADQAKASAQRGERLPRRRRQDGLLGTLDNRRQGPVDVGKDRRLGGPLPELCRAALGGCWSLRLEIHEARHLVSPHDAAPGPEMASSQTLKLAAIGTAAGIFSGLFGVGGGTIIVPLLIFWFGYGERLATGTSLTAIVLIGALGALAQGGIYGNVHVLTGLLLAIPAVLGVVIGTAIQQRIPQRTVSLLFAALLVAIAIELVLQ